MAKIHTRIKRKLGLSTHLRHYLYFHNLIKKHGPKTFKNEESAHLWASSHGLKPEEYSLKKAKHDKRFQVEVIHGENKNITNKKNNS